MFKKIFRKTKPVFSMVPPWIKYPTIPVKSMGWRMGEPQQYLINFKKWWFTLTREEKENYREVYPAPESWHEANYKNSGSFFYDN